MTETTGGEGRREMEQTLRELSLKDDPFRRALLADPRTAIEQKFEIQLPPETEIRVVEETADTVYVVLPFRSPEGQPGGLSDADLEAVAGGGDSVGVVGGSCLVTCEDRCA